MKKFLVLGMLASTLITAGGTSTFAASPSKTTPTPHTVVSDVVNIISEEIVITQDGISVGNEKVIINDLKSVNLDALEELAEAQGINYGSKLDEEEVLNIFTNGIDSVNEAIESGELKVLEHGTIVETDDDGFYLQGGSTYDETYWWGKRRYKSTANANKWASDLNSVGNANAAGAVLAGAIFGGVGAIPNGLTAAYAYQLANRVSYHNSLSDRGIVADLTWLLVFDIYQQ